MENKKINIGLRISKNQYEFLKQIALEYNCEADKLQDVLRAMIVEKMKEKGFYKKIYNNEE